VPTHQRRHDANQFGHLLITEVDFQSEVISGAFPRPGETLKRFYCLLKFRVFLASVREPLRAATAATCWRIPLLNWLSHSDVATAAAKFQSLHVTEVQQRSSFNCHHFASLSRFAFALALRTLAAAFDAFVAISWRFSADMRAFLALAPFLPISRK
jgi:hypothetical protein